MTAGAEDLGALLDLARPLEHGDPCPDPLRDALLATMAARAGPDAPEPPSLGPLEVRREGVPDWWGRENLFLAGPDAVAQVGIGLGFAKPCGNVAVAGSGASVGQMAFPSRGGLVVVGRGVQMLSGSLAAMNGGAVLIGDGCTAGMWARVDARNGGAVLVGPDGSWGSGVNLLTDDMHAIREVESGRRTNGYGGRVVVERHVWLCDLVRLTGGARVGADAVVGFRTWARSPLPAGSVCVGSPAKPIRQGVTWSRADLP